jgi:hypothetical protein
MSISHNKTIQALDYRVCLAKTCTEQSNELLILKLVKTDDVI